MVSQCQKANIKGIMSNTMHIHHSHVSGDIIGYAHSFCKWKVRENKSEITVNSHNLFKFDFFFLLKGLRAGVWRTRDISVSGKNPTDVSFASIGNLVMFLDTTKCFQQSSDISCWHDRWWEKIGQKRMWKVHKKWSKFKF